MIAKNSFIHSPQDIPLKRPNRVHRQRQLKTFQISARKLQLYGKESRSAMSFASLFGVACGPSPENPEADKFVYVKDCDRDVRAHLKLCKILTNLASIDSEKNCY